MTQDDAITQAFKILNKADNRKLNKKDGAELKKLEPFIEDYIFGDLWEAYFVASDVLQNIGNSDNKE